jgi:hypothetical protein
MLTLIAMYSRRIEYHCSFGQEGFDGLDDIAVNVEVVVSHAFGVECGGCVFVCVAAIVDLN